MHNGIPAAIILLLLLAFYMFEKFAKHFYKKSKKQIDPYRKQIGKIVIKTRRTKSIEK